MEDGILRSSTFSLLLAFIHVCPPPSLPPSSFLLDSSAFPAPVNNEGDTPEDLADDEAISELIRAAIQKQGEGRGQGEGEGGRGEDM